jgi:hypothetical protein
MSGLKTLLSQHVESLLPRTDAAACIRPSQYCSNHCDKISGTCFWLHRYCHLSCFGRTHTCGSWFVGKC